MSNIARLLGGDLLHADDGAQRAERPDEGEGYEIG